MQLSIKSKDLKDALKDSMFYERKAESLDSTERKLFQPLQDLHECKVEKQALTEKLITAILNSNDIEVSRKDLKYSLYLMYKLEKQCSSLVHQSELGKLKHTYKLSQGTNDVETKSKNTHIKHLEAEIASLQKNSKQYDNIASTGIRSLIILNTFQKRHHHGKVIHLVYCCVHLCLTHFNCLFFLSASRSNMRRGHRHKMC